MLKPVAEAIFVRGGLSRLLRRFHSGGGLVLAYHNVVPPEGAGHGDRSLHLPVAEFKCQLDQLVRTHDVVPLEALLSGHGEPGPSARPRVAVTFDDGYRGAVTLGVEELRRRGLPGTLFLAPELLGSRTFWWDALADPITGSCEAFRDYALQELGGRQSRIERWAQEAGVPVRSVPPTLESATIEEVQAAVRVPGITVGSHSWDHPNLAALDGEELAAQMRLPLRWLREHFGSSAIPCLAFPYGCTSGRVEAAAELAGYAGALRVDGGWMDRFASRAYALPRINIPAGLSEHGFRLRVDGVLDH